MHGKALLWCLAVPGGLVWGQVPPGYYDPAEGLSGEPLRQALHAIIDNHNVLANSQLWAVFETVDRRPDNTVWDIYSDVPGGPQPYVFQFGADQCGSYAGEGDCFNREHSFPQSWFNDAAPMSTDVFHIYPTDAWVNQRRANWPFGEVNAPTWTSANGGKLGPCSWPGCSGTVFEPIDAYKGDLARSYFYLMTRYMDVAAGWPAPVLAGGDLNGWSEEMLLAWHVADPVSQKEIDRNNTIYAQIQGNRNPFIDRPEWAHAIWGAFAGIEDGPAPNTRITVRDGLLLVDLGGPSAGHVLTVFDAMGRTLLQRRLVEATTTVALPGTAGLSLAVITAPGLRDVHRFVH